MLWAPMGDSLGTSSSHLEEGDTSLLAGGEFESDEPLAVISPQVDSRRIAKLSLSVVFVAAFALLVHVSRGRFASSAPLASEAASPAWWKGRINAAMTPPQATPFATGPEAVQPGGFPGAFGTGATGGQAGTMPQMGMPPAVGPEAAQFGMPQAMPPAPALADQASVNADGINICSPADSVNCPQEWQTGPTGGYFCQATGGCSAWTEDGGTFPKEACADQCAIGVTPAHAKTTPPAPADDAAAKGNDDDGETQTDDDGLVHPCKPDEAECPDEWATAATGGYFCRPTKGCSPWTKEGGSFPSEVCPDQCSVGITPSTITKTTTSITVTTTYPGMGIKLFCWSLAQPGYEFDILRRQNELYAGIFACDDQLIMSFDKLTIGDGDGKVETVPLEKLDSGFSKDGTSANTQQFMKAWEAIKADGRWEKHDWVVKVDPDAVLLPDRLRIHLNAFNGGNTYVRNCNKAMSEGTMMFGALEAISKSALDGYYANFDACNNEIPWQAWGEDLFMMRCLEHVGTSPSEDFNIIQDGVCNGVWCGDNSAAAFHPMKDVPAWEACWHEAVDAR